MFIIDSEENSIPSSPPMFYPALLEYYVDEFVEDMRWEGYVLGSLTQRQELADEIVRLVRALW